MASASSSKYCLLGLVMLGCFISGSLADPDSLVSTSNTQTMADTTAVPSYSSRAAASEALDSTFSADSDLSIEIDPLMVDRRFDSFSRRSGLENSVGIASVESYDSKPNQRSAVPFDARSHAGVRQHHTRSEAEHFSHSHHDHDSRSAHDILQVRVAHDEMYSLSWHSDQCYKRNATEILPCQLSCSVA
jgi:hypothetical protein